MVEKAGKFRQVFVIQDKEGKKNKQINDIWQKREEIEYRNLANKTEPEQ